MRDRCSRRVTVWRDVAAFGAPPGTIPIQCTRPVSGHERPRVEYSIWGRRLAPQREGARPHSRKEPHVAAAITNVAPEGNLTRYLQEIRKFPMLSAEEELELSRRWRDHEDMEAAHKLVTSHLRLVAKIAMGYRGYGLPVGELISEGNVGMMQAVKRFDPDRGFRLATYAMWWIRAAIQEYILHSWSLVKMGTTAAQKKLFFNLRKLKGQMQAI